MGEVSLSPKYPNRLMPLEWFVQDGLGCKENSIANELTQDYDISSFNMLHGQRVL